MLHPPALRPGSPNHMLNVHLRINDATTGKPTPVRIRISGLDGSHYAPLGRFAEFATGRNEDVGGQLKLGAERWFYIDGACEVPLPASVPLRVQVIKGPEYTPLDETVTLGAGQITLRFAIVRWVDSRADGWVSVDTRCHFIPPHAALLEAQAEDVNVVNVLATPLPMLTFDGNTCIETPNLLAFSGQTPALERDGYSVVVNTLNTHAVLGKVGLLHSHRPIFPLAFGQPYDTDDWSICDWCDQCHRKGGLTVWVGAFEPLGGVVGGEGLVAAILGKIDAIEVTNETRKVPLLPWVYRLWNAGVLTPLVGASGKESNKVRVGSVRTYVRREEPHPPTPFPNREGGENPAPPSLREGKGTGGLGLLPNSIRSGRTFVTAGPLLTLDRDGNRLRAAIRAREEFARVEIVANGEVIASGESETEAFIESGRVAARCTTPGASFAHTSPIAVGSPSRKTEAVAALRTLVEQTREWIDTQGLFANPKRKQSLLDYCDEAIRRLEG
ncbi:MAG: hypothetical protein L0241_18195 [Planctomycetia bacterium]|nr:hypothetical protein [Planctomycetia bacterium]